MNTSQNDNSGQGNRDSQHSNQDAQGNQLGQQYGGGESNRFEGNDGRQDEDQRLSSHPDGNESDASGNGNDNEDRRPGERDFNDQNAAGGDQSRSSEGNSEEDRNASDRKNYGGDSDHSESYQTADQEDDERLEEDDLDRNATALDAEEDELNAERPL